MYHIETETIAWEAFGSELDIIGVSAEAWGQSKLLVVRTLNVTRGNLE